MAVSSDEIVVDKPIGNNNSVDDLVSKMGDLNDDDDADDKKDKSGKDKDDEELVLPDDDEDEDENEDENENEDDDEDKKKDKDEKKLVLDDDVILTDVPKRKEILAVFPELFKKFPHLENAFYREQQYAEVFPTPKEAKTALEAVETLKTIEGEFLSGNIEDTLARLKAANPEALGKITKGILKTLAKVDRDAYLGTLTNVTKNMLFTALEFGKKNDSGEDSDGRQLQIAAKILHKHFFQDLNVTPAEAVNLEDEKPDPKKVELDKREELINQRDLQAAVSSVTERINSKLKAVVSESIDKNGVMSTYVKSNAVRDVLRSLDEEMSSDKRFRDTIDRLWSDSKKNNHNEDSKAKIRKALLSKAQTILPDIMRRVKGEALKGSDRKKDSSERPKTFRRSATPPNSNSNANRDNKEKKKPNAGSISDVVDFLSDGK